MVDSSSTLLSANPQLVLADGVCQDTQSQIRQTSLSHYLRTFVGDIFDSATDSSLFSIELENSSVTDELRQALSPAPFNYLLALELAENLNTALDLSQDLGGVSHFLSTKAKHVDSIKVDIGAARLASQRCHTIDNIEFVCEDLQVINFPENHYDLIILGDLIDLSLSKKQLMQLISQLQKSLSKQGCMVLSCENTDRLNRWLSPGEHTVPYQDLYSERPQSGFKSLELQHTLKQSGIEHVNLFATYSQSNAISNLFSQSYLESNSNAINHFNRIGFTDNNNLNEYLLFKNLPENTSLFDTASRYIAVVGNDLAAVNALCQNNFAHFPGTGRQAQWRTVTECKRGSNKVTKTHILNEADRFKLLQASDTEPRLVQDTSVKPFHGGSLLLDDWLHAALANDTKKLTQLIEEYASWLTSLEQQNDFTKFAYDVLPFNILVDAKEQDREFKIIDSEWQLETHYGADFVLFRALFWFTFENKAILKAFSNTTKLTSIGLFIVHFMENVEQISELQTYVDLEEKVQRKIGNRFRSKSIEFALNQLFNNEELPLKNDQPACQISWGNNELFFDEANSVYIDWNKSSQSQRIKSKIPNSTELKTLRVDPIASTGLFHFSAIALRDNKNKIIWQCEYTPAIIELASLNNVIVVQNEGLDSSFVALNDDPHFLFDLSNIDALDTATHIELTLSVIHDQHYDNTLATLSNTVNQQNVALADQANGINEKLAQIEVLQAELNHVVAHRAEIKSTLNDVQQSNQQHVQQLSEHIFNLEQAQLRTPMSRIKRLVKKLLRR